MRFSCSISEMNWNPFPIRSSLPGRRVDLYAEICEVFLGKRHEAIGIKQDLSPSQKQQVLQALAAWMMQQGKREVSREEAPQVIEPALAQIPFISTTIAGLSWGLSLRNA